MTDLPHILVIDDDERLRQLLHRYLSDQGFFVSVAEDAAAARERMKFFQFDALVLDLMMPGETGLEFAATITSASPPILMLTAMAEASDRVKGLELGAGDYLTKPFEPKELVLRLRNLIGRTVTEVKTENPDVRFGQFRFHLPTARLYQNNDEIYLTTAEAALLKALAEKPGQPVSREALAEIGDGISERNNERSVDVQINRLRKKIEPTPGRPIYIRTQRGAGYVLLAD